MSSSSLSGPEWNLTQLFGREDQRQLLQQVVDATKKSKTGTSTGNDIANGSDADSGLVVLHGPAGSGKSSLIQSHAWKEQGWLLASGKYEEHRGAEPFSALIAALNELVESWALNNSVALVCQLGGFCDLLEEDVQFLKNILPKAFQAAGVCPTKWKKKQDSKQKEQMLMSKTSKQKSTSTRSFVADSTVQQVLGTIDCMHAAFWRILKFLCHAQPVILFLDDIHWADQASLDVLKALATSPSATTTARRNAIPGLLLAVSYRDEEVDEQHAVTKWLNEIEVLNGVSQTINVTDLNVEHVNSMIASILLSTQRIEEGKETMELSQVIHQKTNGNPFFVLQFLQMLRQEGFVTFNFQTYKWEWGNVQALATNAHVSDNVADVVATTISHLSEETRVALKVASCLGKVMPLDILTAYFHMLGSQSQQQRCNGHTSCQTMITIQRCGLTAVLDCAVQVGILIQPKDTSTYLWAHDKLQHVAYSLIPESMRPSLHIKLGKLLWKMSSESQHPEDEEWMIYMAADQLNRFSNFQQEEDGTNSLGPEVARLCLEAANLSLSKSALFPAVDMLLAGVQHLDPRERWTEECYDLSLELFSLLAEMAIQIGKHGKAMEAVQEVEDHAKTLDDKFRVQCVMLKCVTIGKSRDYALGVQRTLEVLKAYGEKVPLKLYPGQLFVENRKLRAQLPGGRLEGLLELPVMEDARSIKITKLLVDFLVSYVWMSNRKNSLGCFATSRALNIACTKGVCQETAVGVAGFAMHLRMDGHYHEANEYAELGIKMVDKFPEALGSQHTIVRMIANAGVFSALRPFNNLLERFLDIHHLALRTGDTEKASTTILAYAYTYMNIGLPLGPLESDLVSYGLEARQLKMPETVQVMFHVFRQTILNLQNTVKNPTVLKGRAMDQDEELGKLEGRGRVMTLRDISMFRLLLACVYADWDIAEKMIDALAPTISADNFIIRSHLRLVYIGLAALVLGRTRGKKKYRALGRKIVKIFRSELKKGSVNAHPVLMMLEAEDSPSKERYDIAIKACARLGIIQHEAYMCERAGIFFLEDLKDEGWGEFYLCQAYVLYDDWGAAGKVSQLKAAYPELLRSSSMRETANSALKGRTRYSSKHTDQLKEFSWSRLSSGSSTSSLKTDTRSSTDSLF